MDLLWSEPCHELHFGNEAAAEFAGPGLGKRVRRDEGGVDMGLGQEQREIALAGIAKHGKHAQWGAA